MLKNKDYKNCRLNELKVLSTVSTEYWVVGSSHLHILLLLGYYPFYSCFLGYPVYLGPLLNCSLSGYIAANVSAPERNICRQFVTAFVTCDLLLLICSSVIYELCQNC